MAFLIDEEFAEFCAKSERDGRGMTSDSSTGFILPNGARRSPDAAWTLKSRIEQLDPASRERYWRLCPDFVIELQSSTDRPRVLRDKMREWIANGARFVLKLDFVWNPLGTGSK